MGDVPWAAMNLEGRSAEKCEMAPEASALLLLPGPFGVAAPWFPEAARPWMPQILGVVFLSGLAWWVRERLVRKPGWRVGHEGRDTMYYEELRGGKWRRMRVEGEMLMGRAHHVIYFSATKFPEWAGNRREEIIRRIKSEFRPPDYEYDEN